MACDTNGDGKVSYRDLFERMRGVVPEAWLDWIAENVERGVSEKSMLDVLRLNGFRDGIARSLIQKTKKQGRIIPESNYVDHNHYSVYTVRS